MSISDKNEPFKIENLTADQLEGAKLITKKLQLDDIDEEIDNDEIVVAELLKSLFNPKMTKFIDLNRGKNIVASVQLESGVTKTYDINPLISMIENYINIQTYDSLGGITLYYINKFGDEDQMPENASELGADAINKAGRLVENQVNEMIQNDGIVVNNEEERDELRKKVAERLIREAFINTILILNTYKKSFSRIQNKKIVADRVNRFVDMFNMYSMKLIGYCGEVNKEVKYHCLSDVFSSFSNQYTGVAEDLDLQPLSDEEVISYIEDNITREEFESFIRSGAEGIVDRRKVVKFITSKTPSHDHSKAGMISLDELKRIVDKEQVLYVFEITQNKDVLQFMTSEQMMRVYDEELIDERNLRKYVSLGDILDSSIETEKKMKILLGNGKEKLFNGRESERIWSLYEREEFSIEDVHKLEQIGYFKIEDIVKQYIENTKRPISEELGALLKISDEKLLEYFTPAGVLIASNNNKNEYLSIFYTENIKDIYEKNGMNLEDEIAKELIANSGLSKKSLAMEGFLLYRDKLVSIDILRKLDASCDDIVNYCTEHKDDTKLLIDVFNTGLVPNITMFEEVLDTDFDLACKLIQKGMSARIIQGFETTKALVEMTRPSVDEDGNEIPPILTYENLAEIKEDIETGLDKKLNKKSKNCPATLLELYLTDNLSYAELYGMAEAGVISLEEANEINEKYSLIKDWKALKEKGVEGSPIEGLYENINPEQSQESSNKKGVVGIDEDCIIDFYIALGATEYLEIDSKKCPVFKDYIVIPVMEKKVAYLEGKDGRTYIVPLKIVLEQINNPNGELDLIGNAQSRNAFNSQKKHIRSANHTRNWGRKVVIKTAELPSVPMSKVEAKKFITDNIDIIKAIESSYDTRKYARIKHDTDASEL